MKEKIKFFHNELTINTSGQSLFEITDLINSWIKGQEIFVK